jgi:MinD superfamily P-loop ATPase
MCRVIAVSNQKGGVGKTVAIRISRIRKPIFHVRTDTEKSRS